MQTFLPFEDFDESARVLDYRRLGKQRVEAKQILDCLTGVGSIRWGSHPAVKMWSGHEPSLAMYMQAMITEWVRRGYKNTMVVRPISGQLTHPRWLGDPRVHAGHRSNLLRKDPIYYGKLGWTEPPDMPYFWPTKED